MPHPFPSLMPGWKSELLTPPVMGRKDPAKRAARRRYTAARNRLEVCKGKRRYPSEYEARKLWAEAEGKTGVELRIYRCVICHGFHFTSH